MKKLLTFAFLVTALGFNSCSSDDDSTPTPTPTGPRLIVKFKFDENQIRLNNFGQPSVVSPGNAAQSPIFNTISAHYLELAQTPTTQLGQGEVVYLAAQTTQGGATAIDFSQARIVAEDETFLSIPLSEVAAGSYSWVRVSLAYQNYNIAVRSAGVDYTGALASFVGFNTYIGSHTLGSTVFPVNANRLQGYWAFSLNEFPYTAEGQVPPGGTTVVNPLAATSPIPAGSCVVTGQFSDNLVITGNETSDVIMTLSLSINNSFEWHEVTADGKYEPAIGEYVVDMGLRGLIPSFE